MSSSEESPSPGPSTSNGGDPGAAGAGAIPVGDYVALKVQSLRAAGKTKGDQPLVRIDNRPEAAAAPFIFDIAGGKLHRAGCPAIPKAHRTALYAVWEVRPEDLPTACEKCRPASEQPGADRTAGSNGRHKMPSNTAVDVLFGFISILDQFGSVLSERGRDFRNSDRGQQVERSVVGLLTQLDDTQRETLNTVLSSLDLLIQVVQGYGDSLQDLGNGHHNGNGKDGAQGG